MLLECALPPRLTHEPSMSANKIGRNEPCPCGSGKKYKVCCAESDAPNLGNAAVASALEKLASFATRPEFNERRDRSSQYFRDALGEASNDKFFECLDDLGAEAAFVDLSVFDELFESEQSICDLFLADRASRHLTSGEREALESLANSHFSYYEVLSGDGNELEVEDMVTGARFTAHDAQGADSADELAGSLIATRFYRDTDEAWWMHDFVALVPPNLEVELEEVASTILAAEETKAWSERKRAKAVGGEILRSWIQAMSDAGVEYEFSDPGTLEPTRAAYSIIDRDALEIALASNDRIHFDLISGLLMIYAEPGGPRVDGIAAFREDELSLDALSPKLLAAAREVLEKSAGESMKALRSEPFSLDDDAHNFEPFLDHDEDEQEEDEDEDDHRGHRH